MSSTTEFKFNIDAATKFTLKKQTSKFEKALARFEKSPTLGNYLLVVERSKVTPSDILKNLFYQYFTYERKSDSQVPIHPPNVIHDLVKTMDERKCSYFFVTSRSPSETESTLKDLRSIGFPNPEVYFSGQKGNCKGEQIYNLLSEKKSSSNMVFIDDNHKHLIDVQDYLRQKAVPDSKFNLYHFQPVFLDYHSTTPEKFLEAWKELLLEQKEPIVDEFKIVDKGFPVLTSLTEMSIKPSTIFFFDIDLVLFNYAVYQENFYNGLRTMLEEGYSWEDVTGRKDQFNLSNIQVEEIGQMKSHPDCQHLRPDYLFEEDDLKYLVDSLCQKEVLKVETFPPPLVIALAKCRPNDAVIQSWAEKCNSVLNRN